MAFLYKKQLASFFKKCNKSYTIFSRVNSSYLNCIDTIGFSEHTKFITFIFQLVENYYHSMSICNFMPTIHFGHLQFCKQYNVPVTAN